MKALALIAGTLLVCAIAGVSSFASAAGRPDESMLQDEDQPAARTAAAQPAGIASDRAELLRPMRFRFGIGFVSGETSMQSVQDDIPTILGLELRLGLQAGDLLALMYESSMTGVWPDLRNAVLAEVSLTRYLSIGAGLGLDWLMYIPTGDEKSIGPLPTEWALSAGIPIRIAFNIPTGTGSNGQRYAVALSFEGFPGLTVAGNPGSGLVLGAMGGLSFEMD